MIVPDKNVDLITIIMTIMHRLSLIAKKWKLPIYTGMTHKGCFNNEYVRSLLELSKSSCHRCVDILTIESLKESMNLFVLPICCRTST